MKTTRLFRPSRPTTQPGVADHGPRRQGGKFGTAARTAVSVTPRLAIAAVALGACATATFAPQAFADPPAGTPAKAPCGVLNQIRESLDDDITGGINGVRTTISSPYMNGSSQRRDTDSKLAMIEHGVHYMQDLNGNNVVPGLAPLLDKLDRARGDMKDAVDSLFQINGSGGGYGAFGGGVYTTLAWPQPSTWAAIDYADQKKNDVYALVNNLQGNCAP